MIIAAVRVVSTSVSSKSKTSMVSAMRSAQIDIGDDDDATLDQPAQDDLCDGLAVRGADLGRSRASRRGAVVANAAARLPARRPMHFDVRVTDVHARAEPPHR